MVIAASRQMRLFIRSALSLGFATAVAATAFCFLALQREAGCGPQPAANCRAQDLKGVFWPSKDLSGIDLDKALLNAVNIEGSKLRRAKLEQADLTGARLRDVIFYEADLQGANLTGATARGADFYGADLRGAVLANSDLKRANLERARIAGAVWDGADLRGALWIDGSSVCGPHSFGACLPY